MLHRVSFSIRASLFGFALRAFFPYLASYFTRIRKVSQPSLHKQDAACKTYSLIRQPTRTLHDILISSKSLLLKPRVFGCFAKIFFRRTEQKKSLKLKFLSMKNVHRREQEKEEINVEAKTIAPYVELLRIREMCGRNGKLLLLLVEKQ